MNNSSSSIQFSFLAICIVLMVMASCEEERDPLQLIYGSWQTSTWSRTGCEDEGQDQAEIPCTEPDDDVDCVTLTFYKDGKVETLNEDGTTDHAFYSITENGFLISDAEDDILFAPWNFSQETMNLQTTGDDGCAIRVSYERL